MRALALAIAAWVSGCWVGPAYVVDEPPTPWCANAPYPDARCEQYYVWVEQGYAYRGRWHGGRYVLRPHVYVRDHRR